ncbi:MFS transporter [Nocardia sp. NPDC052566]|uniref:MFS transporter n=1 Tax=Nocardia sp. NPDC052566 TaxID=3364330 RepID=UPI0037CBF1C2
MTTDRSPTPSRATQRRGVVVAVAVCCGVTVANIYLALPLLTLIAESFGLTPGAAGAVATSGQIGYAAGLFFLVPLGDMVRRRRLVSALLLGTVLALVIGATATGLAHLAAAAALIGLLTVVPQVLIPFIAQVVPPDRQGRALSAVQAGMMSGIVLSRVIGGNLGQQFGWRDVYLVAAVLTALAGAVTVWILPDEPVRERQSYPALMASLFALLAKESRLRWACALQVLTFGAFSLIWTSLVFLLTSSPFEYSVATAGLFGLFGLISAAGAPIAGRLIDTRGPGTILPIYLGVLLLAALAFCFAQSQVALIIAGIILLNLGAQGVQVANQTTVFTLFPQARSRVNTVFMVSSFAGGAIAAQLGASLYGANGWRAVSLAALVIAAVSLVVWLLGAMVAKRSTKSEVAV